MHGPYADGCRGMINTKYGLYFQNDVEAYTFCRLLRMVIDEGASKDMAAWLDVPGQTGQYDLRIERYGREKPDAMLIVKPLKVEFKNRTG